MLVLGAGLHYRPPMKKLTAAFVASMSLLAACKKEEPKPAPKSAEQALADALKAAGAAGSGSAASAGDLGAALGALAGMAAPGGGSAGGAAAGAATGSGSAADMKDAMAGLGKAAAALGALAGMAGGGGLSPENQAIITEFNGVVTQLQALVAANPDNCAALGSSMAPFMATNAATFKKMEGLKADETQKAAIALTLASGPALGFAATMAGVAIKCKDDASFQKAWDSIKGAF